MARYDSGVRFDSGARFDEEEEEITTVDPIAGPYVTKVQKAGSAADVDGLTSGQRVWARVRGIGSDTKGPWTDPVTKIVP